MKKICFITATRAEYGLLKWIMKEVDLDVKVDQVGWIPEKSEKSFLDMGSLKK